MTLSALRSWETPIAKAPIHASSGICGGNQECEASFLLTIAELRRFLLRARYIVIESIVASDPFSHEFIYYSVYISVMYSYFR